MSLDDAKCYYYLYEETTSTERNLNLWLFLRLVRVFRATLLNITRAKKQQKMMFNIVFFLCVLLIPLFFNLGYLFAI